MIPKTTEAFEPDDSGHAKIVIDERHRTTEILFRNCELVNEENALQFVVTEHNKLAKRGGTKYCSFSIPKNMIKFFIDNLQAKYEPQHYKLLTNQKNQTT